jgi:hypothetical protein
MGELEPAQLRMHMEAPKTFAKGLVLLLRQVLIRKYEDRPVVEGATKLLVLLGRQGLGEIEVFETIVGGRTVYRAEPDRDPS